MRTTDRIEKAKAINVRRADAGADIGLINRYAVKELKPEDVYCFTVRLCDNDVDRDTERFTDKSLETLAPMFLGKTGIFDHYPSAENQLARLYRTEVAATGERNRLGQPTKALVGSAYIPRTDGTKNAIEAIETGIMKEVSVGVAMGRCSCSICGGRQRLNWENWKYQCEKGHIRGEEYDGKLCVGELEDPQDAYEFSFVAVPSQRAAGVIKSAGDQVALDHAFQALAQADLSGQEEKVKALLPRLQTALTDAEERKKRAEIMAENQKYRKNQ